jgi:hypothetical protein
MTTTTKDEKKNEKGAEAGGWGPRDVDIVSWAIGKFFFFSLSFLTKLPLEKGQQR